MKRGHFALAPDMLALVEVIARPGESTDDAVGRLLASSAIAHLVSLPPTEFEHVVGHSLARQGYDVAYVGGKGDQGIDLIAKGHGEVVAVQCKRYDSATITPNQIREFLGAIVAALATRGVFVTTSVFTEAARAFAEGHPIDLVDRTVLVAWLIRKGARGPGLKCKNCGAVAKIQSESTLAWACAVCNEFNLV